MPFFPRPTGRRSSPHRRDPAGVRQPADLDVALLFLTRSLRMIGYGFLSVVLVLYLTALGLSGAEVGLLLT